MGKEQNDRYTGDNGGFSLVELVIAIAIIVILTGLFSGFYIKYVEKSKITKQEDSARKLYDAAELAILDFVINADDMGFNYDNVTPKYHDPVTGKTCGMITTSLVGAVASGASPSGQPEETQMVKYILETLGSGIDWSNDDPRGAQCNYSDKQVRVIIVFNEKGIYRLEYGQDKFLTTIESDMVQTQKWSSANQVKFTNPS
jgi:prepilin-type N-terminal cleavage/methylation domain-containing protein